MNNALLDFIELKRATIKDRAAGLITTDEANRVIQPALTQAIKDSGLPKEEFILMVLKQDQKWLLPTQLKALRSTKL